MLLLRRFLRHRMALVGLAFILVLTLAAVLAPLVAPYDPLEMNLRDRLQGPSAQHLLGTDNVGRDTLSRLIHGARYSLTIGLVSVGIGLVVGGFLGVIAGLFGGVLDRAVSAVIEVLMAFPGVLLALAIVAALGPGLFNVMIAVGIWSIPIFARVARTSTLVTKELPFVEAALAMGAGSTRLIVRHVIPNALPTLMVLGTLRMAAAILTAAGLSFLGLGAQPPTPEWGAMLNDSRKFMRDVPWPAIFSGGMIMVTVMAFNFVGDALRDVLDPKSK